jgi:hypothetical protein
MIRKNDGGLRLKELKLTERQLQELVETYDMHMDEIEFFLHIDTGDVITLTTFDRDAEDMELNDAIEEGFNETYFRIPCRESNEGYMDMVDFAETVTNEKLRVKLITVLNGGKGMFRKFKDPLSSDSRELERYYHFVENRNRERVMQWLESIHVKVTVIK